MKTLTEFHGHSSRTLRKRHGHHGRTNAHTTRHLPYGNATQLDVLTFLAGFVAVTGAGGGALGGRAF